MLENPRLTTPLSALERRDMTHVFPSCTRRARVVALLCVTVGSLVFASWAQAAIINVSTAPQLQAAFTSAAAGDTIVVAPGSYAPDAPMTVSVDNLTVVGSQTANTRINGSNITGPGGVPPDMFDVNANGFTLKNLALQQTANNGTVLNVFGTGAR